MTRLKLAMFLALLCLAACDSAEQQIALNTPFAEPVFCNVNVPGWVDGPLREGYARPRGSFSELTSNGPDFVTIGEGGQASIKRALNPDLIFRLSPSGQIVEQKITGMPNRADRPEVQQLQWTDVNPLSSEALAEYRAERANCIQARLQNPTVRQAPVKIPLVLDDTLSAQIDILTVQLNNLLPRKLVERSSARSNVSYGELDPASSPRAGALEFRKFEVWDRIGPKFEFVCSPPIDCQRFDPSSFRVANRDWYPSWIAVETSGCYLFHLVKEPGCSADFLTSSRVENNVGLYCAMRQEAINIVPRLECMIQRNLVLINVQDEPSLMSLKSKTNESAESLLAAIAVLFSLGVADAHLDVPFYFDKRQKDGFVQFELSKEALDLIAQMYGRQIENDNSSNLIEASVTAHKSLEERLFRLFDQAVEFQLRESAVNAVDRAARIDFALKRIPMPESEQALWQGRLDRRAFLDGREDDVIQGVQDDVRWIELLLRPLRLDLSREEVSKAARLRLRIHFVTSFLEGQGVDVSGIKTDTVDKSLDRILQDWKTAEYFSDVAEFRRGQGPVTVQRVLESDLPFDL